MVGFAKVIEVTHGDNGWHPHYHVVIVMKSGTEEEAIAAVEELRAAWEHQLDRVGLTYNEHAFDVRGAGAVGDYITKGWGADKELTLGSAKLGREGGRTLGQLLRDSRRGDRQATDLWWEAILVMRGVHRLRWSPGLRAIAKEELARLGAKAKDGAEEAGEAPPPEPLDELVRSFGDDDDRWQGKRVGLMEAAEATTLQEARAQARKLLKEGPTDAEVIGQDEVTADPNEMGEAPARNVRLMRRAAPGRIRDDATPLGWAWLQGAVTFGPPGSGEGVKGSRSGP